MTFRSKGGPQRVLVVGASRGIGLELVRQYRADGADVTGTARGEDGLAAIRALGATALELDVADPASSLEGFNVGGGGGFDVAIHCAGVYGPRLDAPHTPDRADFDAVMQANVYGPMRVLPMLSKQLTPGARLAVVSSRMGSIGSRSGSNGWLYRASKAAVNSVLKDMSIALAGRAVCVALHPGWVRTDMGGEGADLDASDSVRGLRQVLAGLTDADNGGFFNHDGSTIAW
ncbi:MAG: SDR family oxidoreductase [Rubrivivax sp.]